MIMPDGSDKNAAANAPRPAVEEGPETERTGLPLLRTWRGVYLFVMSCFILWVLLLLCLSVTYR